MAKAMTTSNDNQHAHCHCLYSASMIFRDNLVGPTESHGPVLPMMKCDSLQLLQHEAVELLICHRLWRSRGTSATGSLPATTPRGSRPRPRLRLGSNRLRSCKQPEQGLCQHRVVGHHAGNQQGNATLGPKLLDEQSHHHHHHSNHHHRLCSKLIVLFHKQWQWQGQWTSLSMAMDNAGRLLKHRIRKNLTFTGLKDREVLLPRFCTPSPQNFLV